MTRIYLLIAFLLMLAIPVRADPPNLVPPPSDADEAAWALFSENLVVALKVDNDGVRTSALQHVAFYGERLDVREAKFEIVRLFRDNHDHRVRLLALNALSKVHDAWVTDFLRRSARHESDSHMAALIYHAAAASDRG